MNSIAGYMMTLVCGGILAGLVRTMAGESGRGLPGMICGIFMAFLVIAPLHDMDFALPELPGASGSRMAEEAVRQGTAQAEAEMFRVISGQTAAYILDQAERLGVRVEVRVTVDPETRRPDRVILTGDPDPRQKEALARILEEELSVERGNQIWQKKTP